MRKAHIKPLVASLIIWIATFIIWITIDLSCMQVINWLGLSSELEFFIHFLSLFISNYLAIKIASHFFDFNPDEVYSIMHLRASKRK